MKNNKPILYHEKSECCGCAACYAICPQEAILMEKDEEGFEYPNVIENKCVGCLMCMNVCPFKSVN